jgi:protein TonB
MITGRVIDEAGKPVPYASIIFKGSSKGGTWTMEDGSYSTFIPNGYDTIICTHINYLNKIEKVEGNNIINLILVRQIPRQSKIAVVGTHKYSQDELTILKNKKNELAKDDSRIFTKVEIYASFIGGEDAFQKYLARTIIYPDSATISNVKGTVQASFIIDKNGLAKNVTLLKGINKFADDLVLQAIIKMPNWIPAVQNGRNVEQYKEVSVSFDITGSE